MHAGVFFFWMQHYQYKIKSTEERICNTRIANSEECQKRNKQKEQKHSHTQLQGLFGLLSNINHFARTIGLSG